MAAGAGVGHIEQFWQHEGRCAGTAPLAMMSATAGPFGSSCLPERPGAWDCGYWLLTPMSALWAASACTTETVLFWSGCSQQSVWQCLPAQSKGNGPVRGVAADTASVGPFALWSLKSGHSLCCTSEAGAQEACGLACRLRAADPGRFPDPGPVETTRSWQGLRRAVCQRSSSSCW